MKYHQKYQTGFNRYPVQSAKQIVRPENYAGLEVSTPVCVRGLGGSYGDAALNKNGQIILTERLDRFLEFDEKQGIICVEAGISLSKILDIIVPRGWFFPVTPGTSNVSLGGCVATDVHGKNHCYAGSLGQHILALELITAQGERVICSPEVLPELFWATVGGMGLTGIIGTVTLKLKAIASAYMLVQYQASDNLEKTFAAFSEKNVSDEYKVAWLDGLNLPLGRSIIISACHADRDALSFHELSEPYVVPVRKVYTIPFYFPKGILHQTFIKTFNKYYYQRILKKNFPSLLPYCDYFYPLDRIRHWPRLYGRRGFIQYQCVIPSESAYRVIKQILESLYAEKYPIYLAVLKRFGKQNPAPLSFPLPGFTLALDLPLCNEGLLTCLNKLDVLVSAAGGRVYLAKDARLKPEIFRAMYPRYLEWLTVKRQWDPQANFISSLARRLELIP